MKTEHIITFLLLTLTCMMSAAKDADESKPTFRLYDLEYKIMPDIANTTVPGELYEESLVDVKPVINALVEYYGLVLEFNPDEIIAQPFVRGDVRGVVYTFPEPLKMPLAKYGAIVFTSVTENRYFTLESSINFGEGESKCWVLGETVSAVSHRNFGMVPDCNSPEEFIDLLEKMDKLQPSDADGKDAIETEEKKQ
ncbi:MAG: hypothetical protein HDR83_08005 [Bacteroides sp.]|nr:hypothetical protein [Bacteroides sp.]